MMGYRPFYKLQMKNNITMIYDCKYSEEDYSLAEVQQDVISVFRLGSSMQSMSTWRLSLGCHATTFIL